MIDWFFISNNDGRGAAIAVVLFVAIVPVMIWNIRRFREAGGDPMSATDGPVAANRPTAARRRRAGEARRRRLVRPDHDHRDRRALADPDRSAC